MNNDFFRYTMNIILLTFYNLNFRALFLFTEGAAIWGFTGI